MPRTEIRIPLPPAAGDQDTEVTLNIDLPISPHEAFGTPDGRPLAVSVFGVDAE
jgi:hypothetical protein